MLDCESKTTCSSTNANWSGSEFDGDNDCNRSFDFDYDSSCESYYNQDLGPDSGSYGKYVKPTKYSKSNQGPKDRHPEKEKSPSKILAEIAQNRAKLMSTTKASQKAKIESTIEILEHEYKEYRRDNPYPDPYARD